MKFLTEHTHITYCGERPVDMNDREREQEAIELALPDNFSDKAKECWDYFEGAAFLFEYQGKLIMTDESLYLTEHGDGSHEAPFGAPRGEFESWDEVEDWLEEVYDELKEEDVI